MRTDDLGYLLERSPHFDQRIPEIESMRRKAWDQFIALETEIAAMRKALQQLCDHGGAMEWLEMHATYIREAAEAAIALKANDVPA